MAHTSIAGMDPLLIELVISCLFVSALTFWCIRKRQRSRNG